MTSVTNSDSQTLQFEGGWLLFARALWLALIGLPVAAFIVLLPTYIDQVSTLSGVSLLANFTTPDWTFDTLSAALAETGIPFWVYLSIRAGNDALIPVVYLSAALVLYIRSGHEWIGWYTALMLALLGLSTSNVTGVPVPASANWITVLPSLPLLGWLSFYVFLFIFPDGRIQPRWMRFVVFIMVMALPVITIFGSSFIRRPIAAPIILILFGAGIYSQVYRYTRVSGATERLQTRWLITSIIMMGSTILIAGFLIPALVPASAQPGPEALFLTMGQAIVFAFMFITLPVALGIAVLRYHLWNIDVIIRRTLTYALITLLLGAVYYGSVVLMQTSFVRLTGQDSPVTVVASTLLIAALFNPLRRRVQAFVDRRFYRRKYDLARTLDDFAASLYEEVDIERLADSLVSVVDQTMKPQHVSLWVNEPGGERYI